MSVEVCVFINDGELPTHEAWQLAIDATGSSLRMDNFSPHTHSGFLPSQLNGRECGFEYSFGPIDDYAVTDLGDWIGGRNRVASFVWHGNELDMRAAILAAAALAKLTDGVYLDPQSGEVAQGPAVYAMLEQQDADDRERRMRLAVQKWGHTTSRRCPRCNAPCPEYRNKCSVCEFEVGREVG